MGCNCTSSVATAVDPHDVDNGKGFRAGKAATVAQAQSSQAPIEAGREAVPGLRAAAKAVSEDESSSPPSLSTPAPLATGQEKATAIALISPTSSELDTVRTPRGPRPEQSDASLRKAAAASAAVHSPAQPYAIAVERRGAPAQAVAPGTAAATEASPPVATAPAPAPEPTMQHMAARSRSPRYCLPGAVDVGLSPRVDHADSRSQGPDSRASGANVDKAFAALTSDGDNMVDLDEAFALLESPKNEHTQRGQANAVLSVDHEAPCLGDWPLDLEVSPVTRVLLLTWARWSRNSLRIQTEAKIKALQHVRYPRDCTPPRTPPLSPQPTPRGTPADIVAPSHVSSRPFTLSKEETVTSRTVTRPRELLFDQMAEAQRDSMEAQAMRVKLNNNFAIEGAHTDSKKTPGFGVDTPNFPGGIVKSRASPLESVVSSGVATPAQAGQLSPWLLEAEALCNGEDDITDKGPDLLRTSLAWGKQAGVSEGNSAPSRPSSSLEFIPEVERSQSKESNEPIDYEDELEKVGLFVTATLVEATMTNSGVDVDDSPFKAKAQVADSLASTAITLGEELSSPLRAPAATSAELRVPAENAATTGFPEYAIGEKVSYWSASKSVWLPARIVERKSRHVYLIDKQMKGCLSKVRDSELLSEAEERQDPVLRAFCAFEPEPRTPRNRAGAGRSRSARRSESTNEGFSASLPARPQAVSPRTLPPLQHSPRFSGTLVSPFPPPKMGAAKPRGRIVRDDFSDDSEDD